MPKKSSLTEKVVVTLVSVWLLLVAIGIAIAISVLFKAIVSMLKGV